MSPKPPIEPSIDRSPYIPLKSQDEPPAPAIIEHEPAPTDTGTGYPPDFEQWWNTYPKKTGKPSAYDAWRNALTKGPEPKPTPIELIQAAKVYALSRMGQPSRYTKAPAGWLRDRRWEDTPDMPTQTNSFLAMLNHLQGGTNT